MFSDFSNDQGEKFPEEYRAATSNKQLPTKSKILNLKPKLMMMDFCGVMTRLE